MQGVGIAFGRFSRSTPSGAFLIGACVVFAYRGVRRHEGGVTYTQVAQYCVLITAYTIPAVFNLAATHRQHRSRRSASSASIPIPASRFFSSFNQIVTDLGFAEYTAAPRLDDQHGALHPLADDRDGGSAPRHHALLHRSKGVGRPLGRPVGRSSSSPFLYLTAPAVGGDGPAQHLPKTDVAERDGQPGGQLEQIRDRPGIRTGWPPGRERGLLDWEDKNGDRPHPVLQTTPMPSFRNGPRRMVGKATKLTRSTQEHPRARQPRDREPARLGDRPRRRPEVLPPRCRRAAGLLLAISSAVSHDLLKGQLTPNMSEKSELLAARISMAAAIVVAVILGLNPPGFAAQTVGACLSVSPPASIFPALMMGIFLAAAPRAGAVWGPVAGPAWVGAVISSFTKETGVISSSRKSIHSWRPPPPPRPIPPPSFGRWSGWR